MRKGFLICFFLFVFFFSSSLSLLESELSLVISLESEEDSSSELDCLVAVASGDTNLSFAALDLELGRAVVSSMFVSVSWFF